MVTRALLHREGTPQDHLSRNPHATVRRRMPPKLRLSLRHSHLTHGPRRLLLHRRALHHSLRCLLRDHLSRTQKRVIHLRVIT